MRYPWRLKVCRRHFRQTTQGNTIGVNVFLVTSHINCTLNELNDVTQSISTAGYQKDEAPSYKLDSPSELYLEKESRSTETGRGVNGWRREGGHGGEEEGRGAE